MPDLMKLMEDWNGYASASDIGKAEGYERKLTEVVDLLSNAKGLPAHKHEYLIREVLTTSDFPLLFGDVLQRQMLATYKAAPPVWKPFTKVSTVPRMAPHIGGKRFSMSGGDQVLDKIVEKGEYLASDRVEKQYDITVNKYGRQFDISWETMINDDLGALKDTPERFARAAVRTEHRIVTTLYARNAVTYIGAHGNMAAGALTIANLETGLEAMAAFVDGAGEPIMNRAKYLVVPPALEMTALAILNSTTMMRADAGAPAPYPTTNVVAKAGLTLVVDPYLPVIDTTDGATGWYLFADPNDIAALEVAWLRGHERPEICMKASDKVTVGGGAINPMSGDFATDNVFYRVRLVFGGVTEDWRATYMGGSTL